MRPEYDSLTPESTYDEAARLSLPTPSLLGLPTDEAGYRTLWRYYGRQISDRLWQLRLSPNGMALFDNERLAQAAWQRLLVQQNLIVWPPPERQAPTWPDATLAVLCLDEDNSFAWWHYLPQTAEWVTVLRLSQVTAVRALAESALLIQEKRGNQRVWQIIWPDGTQRMLATSAFASPDLRPVTNGRQVRLTTPETASALLLDVNACHQNSCDWQVSPETAVISPNGQQQIRVNGLGLIRSNSAGTEAEAIKVGFAPFWLQDEIYGYLRPMPGQSGIIEVVAATTRNDKPYRLFTSQDLQALLPNQTESLLINSIALSTSDFTRLTIVATVPEQNQTFTFSFYRITGEITLATATEPLADQGQSPDGRWTIQLQDASLTLRDLHTNTPYNLTPPNAACAYTAWVK